MKQRNDKNEGWSFAKVGYKRVEKRFMGRICRRFDHMSRLVGVTEGQVTATVTAIVTNLTTP